MALINTLINAVIILMFSAIMLLEVLLAVVLGVITYLYVTKKKEEETLPMGSGWWGNGQKPDSEEDVAIHPFKVEISDSEINVSKLLSCRGADLDAMQS